MCNEAEPVPELTDAQILDIWKSLDYDYATNNVNWLQRIILTVREAIEKDRKLRGE